MARCSRSAVVPCRDVPPVGAHADGRAVSNTVDISELANAGVACLFSSRLFRVGFANTVSFSISGVMTPSMSASVPYQG